MKIRNLFVFIISTGIPLFLSGHSFVAHIEILGKKDVYLYGEPIVIKSSIWNEGEKRMAVIPGFVEGNFIVYNSKGKRLHKRKVISEDYLSLPTIAPGDTISWIGEIFTGFQCAYDPYMNNFFLPPEEYTYQAYYLIPNNTDNYDTLKSNIIKIKIVEPEGKEKEAFELYRESMHLWRQPTIGKTMKKFDELLLKYPHSAYAPRVFDILTVLLQSRSYRKYDIKIFGRKMSLKEGVDEFLKRYPNSGVSAMIVRSIGDLGGRKEIKIFRNIIKKYKGTPAAISAKLMIKKTKKHMEREKILKERGFRRR